MKILSVTHPKPGERRAQDVVAVSARRVAVADGMSGTRFPRAWAKWLCQRAVSGPSLVDAVASGTVQQWLEPGIDAWRAHRQRALAADPKLAMFIAPNEPAGSTLLVLELRGRRWTAVAFGDTVLCIEPANGEPEWWPLTSAAEFCQQTEGLVTDRAPPPPQLRSGVLPAGGRLFVLTDGLAKVLLQRGEVLPRGQSELLRRVSSLLEFADDDVTVVVIEPDATWPAAVGWALVTCAAVVWCLGMMGVA